MFAVLSALCSTALAVSLEEAWAAADAHSVELALVHEQRVQGDALDTKALALISPKLVLGSNYTINQYETALDFSTMIPKEFQSLLGDTEPIVVNKKAYLDWNASLVQPIFSGQAFPLLIAARDTVKAGAETEDALRGQIRTGVAQAWWGVVVSREGERVATQALENARKHLQIATTGVTVGTAAPTVKLQAELGVARAERQVAMVHATVVGAEQAFARLTGLAADSPVELPAPRVLPYATVDNAIERAWANRPDIQAAELQAHAAAANATATSLSWLPSVDGRFTEAYSGNSGFSGQEYNWQLVFSAHWTLWDGGARLADQSIVASQRRMADLQVDSLHAKAEEQVRRLWEEHARSEAAVTAMAKELELAGENLRLAEAAFAAGSLSYLEVDDARLGLVATRTSALQEQMTRDLTAIQLLEATGDL